MQISPPKKYPEFLTMTLLCTRFEVNLSIGSKVTASGRTDGQFLIQFSSYEEMSNYVTLVKQHSIPSLVFFCNYVVFYQWNMY